MPYFEKWLPPEQKLQCLKSHKLFTDKLLSDIEKGRVFPAVRSEKIDFYHLGRKLFSFDGEHFRTNVKFALTHRPDSDNEVKDADLKGLLVDSFKEAYDGIKNTIKVYAQGYPESKEVSRLWEQYSYAKKSVQVKHGIVVFDVERSLEATERSSDRIDIVLLNRAKKQLLFIEVKGFWNAELRVTDLEEIPKVIGQIGRYSEQLNNDVRRDEILSRYKDYVSIVAELVGQEDLAKAKSLIRTVPLLVIGFHNSHKDEIKTLKSDFARHKVTVLARGGLKNVSQGTLLEWWKDAEG